jgi:hypothetical protein
MTLTLLYHRCLTGEKLYNFVHSILLSCFIAFIKRLVCGFLLGFLYRTRLLTTGNSNIIKEWRAICPIPRTFCSSG